LGSERHGVMLERIRKRSERAGEAREVGMRRDGLPYPERRDLARRVSDGLVVTLWWDGSSTDLAVSVTSCDRREFQIVVEGREALHAFYHPFAVAAARGATTPDEAA
jgi:hypothetical protein